MIISTKAIVLKSSDYLESSKLLKVYTQKHGLVTLIAKGAQKTKSKFGSAIQPLSIINITYYHKNSREIQILSEVDYLRSLNKINKDINKMAIGLMICESLLQTQQKNDSDAILFDNLVNIIFNINDTNNIFLLFIFSQVKLSDNLGFSINFVWKVKSEVDYNPNSHVFVRLSDCAISKSSKVLIENYIKMKVESLLAIKETKLNKNFDFKISENTFKEIVYFFEDYFSFHLDTNFKYKSVYLLN